MELLDKSHTSIYNFCKRVQKSLYHNYPGRKSGIDINFLSIVLIHQSHRVVENLIQPPLGVFIFYIL